MNEVLTNLFKDINSEMLESVLETVRQIEVLFGAGDLIEVPDVVKFLREDNKELYKEYRIKNVQNENY